MKCKACGGDVNATKDGLCLDCFEAQRVENRQLRVLERIAVALEQIAGHTEKASRPSLREAVEASMLRSMTVHRVDDPSAPEPHGDVTASKDAVMQRPSGRRFNGGMPDPEKE